MNSIKINNSKRGYAIFLSVITASLLTTLAGALYFISSKEVSFASVIRDSQYAFYVADLASECALYLNYYEDAFNKEQRYTDKVKFVCANSKFKKYKTNQDLQYTGGCSSKLNGKCRTIFEFDTEVTDINGKKRKYCAVVQVLKYTDTDGYPRTTIDARGYNFSCSAKNSGANVANPVERAIRLDL